MKYVIRARHVPSEVCHSGYRCTVTGLYRPRPLYKTFPNELTGTIYMYMHFKVLMCDEQFTSVKITLRSTINNDLQYYEHFIF